MGGIKGIIQRVDNSTLKFGNYCQYQLAIYYGNVRVFRRILFQL